MITEDDILEHFGVKGMHWGVRKSSSGGGKATTSHPHSDDSTKAKAAVEKAKTSGLHSLSNQELRILTERMNLEQSYSRLAGEKGKLEKGHNEVKKVLAVAGTLQTVYALSKSPMVKDLMKMK